MGSQNFSELTTQPTEAAGKNSKRVPDAKRSEPL